MPDSHPLPTALRLECEWDVAERRGHARYLARARAHVVDVSKQALLGQVLDISAGGLRLLTPQPVPPARRYHLALYLQVGARYRSIVEVIARCAWHRARPLEQFEAGFEFVELQPDAHAQLAAFIDALE